MTDSEIFTKEISKYMNTFVNAIAKDKEIVLAKLLEFPGDHKVLLRKAISEGPETLPANDTAVCRSMFNFIVFFATGKLIEDIEVDLKKTENSDTEGAIENVNQE